MTLNTSYVNALDRTHIANRRTNSIPSILETISSARAHTELNKYADTTFGRSGRMRLPKVDHRQDFSPAISTLDKRYGSLSKSSRQALLNIGGRDSPSPSKYNLNDTSVRSSKHSYSFGIAHDGYAKVVVPEMRQQYMPSITPGPGSYNWHRSIGGEKPKYSMGQRLGCSYLPNTQKNPPVTKYKPENFELPRKFTNISLGIGKRDFSYIRKSDVPGPASYAFSTIDRPTAHPRVKNVSVDKAPRELLHIVQKVVPGPGTYNLGVKYSVHDWTEQRQKAKDYKELRRGRSIKREYQYQNHNNSML